MAPTAPADDSDDEDGGRRRPAGPPVPSDGWEAVSAPVVFKDLRLRIKRPPPGQAGQSEPPEGRYRPKYGVMHRSHCVVHLQRLGGRSGEEAFEFILGETSGFARPLPDTLQGAGLAAKGETWSPPKSSDTVVVPRWVTEGVIALGSSASAEFEPVLQDSDEAGGLFGQCRLTLLAATPAQDLLGDGGVLIRVLEEPKEGDSGPKPRDLARVCASWRVWFARSNELLLSIGALAQGESAASGREFTIDESGLMVAMEMALKELRPGSRACVRISQEWASGALTPEGNPSLRGAAIWVELILHSVQNEPGPGEHGSASAALEFALTKKQQGNASLALLTGADIGRAARRYEAGIDVLEAVLPEGHSLRSSSSSSRTKAASGPVASEGDLPSVEEALTALRLNAGQAELKRCRWKEAAEHCSVVLRAAEGHGKARFRRGLARAELGDLVGAAEDLRRALAASPGDVAARRELARVEALRKERKAEERGTFGGLFEKMRQKDEAREQREEARRKAEEEQEAKRKKEEQEKKREQARKDAEEKRKREAEEAAAKEAAAKEAAATEAAAREAAGTAAEAAEAPSTAPVPAAAAPAPAPAAQPAEADPRPDHQLLEALERDKERGRPDQGGPGSILPLMPPSNIPIRTVDDAPPVKYEVPAFLRRGAAKKAKG